MTSPSSVSGNAPNPPADVLSCCNKTSNWTTLLSLTSRSELKEALPKPLFGEICSSEKDVADLVCPFVPF